MKKILRMDVVLFLLIVALPMIANSLGAPIFSLYLNSIGITPAVLGLMFSVQMVALAIGEASLGFLTDKVGFKTIMFGAPIFYSIFFGLLVLTTNVTALYIAFFSSGLAIASGAIAGRVYGATIGTSEEKPFYMALIQTVFRVSQAGGSLAGGWIAEKSGYTRVFQTSLGVLMMPILLLVADLRKNFLNIRKPHQVDHTQESLQNEPSGGRWRLPSAVFQGVAAALIFVGHGTSGAFLPLLASEIAHASDQQVGLLFAAMNVFGAILTFPAAAIARRIGKELAMIYGLLLAGLGMAGMVFFPSFWFILFFVAIRSFASPLFTVPGLALISDTLPARRQGAGMGLYGLSEDVGLMIGSAAGGFLWTSFGYKAPFLLGTASAAAGMLVVLVLLKYIKPRLQQEQAFSRTGMDIV